MPQWPGRMVTSAPCAIVASRVAAGWQGSGRRSGSLPTSLAPRSPLRPPYRHLGDGRRVYVALENGDGVLAVDTLTNKVLATMHSRQSPQHAHHQSRTRQAGGRSRPSRIGRSGELDGIRYPTCPTLLFRRVLPTLPIRAGAWLGMMTGRRG